MLSGYTCISQSSPTWSPMEKYTNANTSTADQYYKRYRYNNVSNTLTNDQ